MAVDLAKREDQVTNVLNAGVFLMENKVEVVRTSEREKVA